jgi:phosphatidylserine decarboxylase
MMYLTLYGKREWLGSGVLAALLSLGWLWTARHVHFGTGCILLAFTWLLWMAIAAFFRVPVRVIPEDPAVLVSPADGVVRDIEIVEDHGIEVFAGRKLTRIGIFLSVFDVHVNRAPCAMIVESRQYREGRFLDARDPRCARENESLVISGAGRAANRCFPVAVRQISGAIARRIVCTAQPRDKLSKGGIYGMIKFGSRTELYLPCEDGIRVCVKVGDKVRSGSSAVARVEPEGGIAL